MTACYTGHEPSLSKVPESKHALCFYLPLQRSTGVEGIVLGRVLRWSLLMSQRFTARSVVLSA